MGKMTLRWCKHLLGCQRKGMEAFARGEGRESCPYRAVNTCEIGGKNLTRQRVEYWLYGWERAKKESCPSKKTSKPP